MKKRGTWGMLLIAAVACLLIGGVRTAADRLSVKQDMAASNEKILTQEKEETAARDPERTKTIAAADTAQASPQTKEDGKEEEEEALLVPESWHTYLDLTLDDMEMVPEDEEGISYSEGEVVLFLAEDTDPEAALEQINGLGLWVEEEELASSLASCAFCVASVADGSSVNAVLERIVEEAPESIAYAQPNFIYTPADEEFEEVLDEEELTPQATVINDPRADEQWHLEAIHAYDAWDIQRVEGSVAVAVIDTGVDAEHEDLAGRIVDGYNAVDYSTDTSDVLGHGSHIAGIIAAQTDNAIGVSGVSYNANIIPIRAAKVSEKNTATFSSTALYSSYSYLLRDRDKNGVSDLVEEYNLRVINMSLGSLGSVSADKSLLQMVDKAYEQNILTVCSAGNNGTENVGSRNTYYPGDYETCMCVINLDTDLKRYVDDEGNSSNYGDAKDISAPGTAILSANNEGTYYKMTGTSMAAPVVSAVAALVFAKNGDYTVDQVRTILEATAQDLGEEGFDNETAWGCVDALRAVEVTYEDHTVVIDGGEHAEISDGSHRAECFSETLAFGETLAGDYSVFPEEGYLLVGFASEDGTITTALPTGRIVEDTTYTAVCVPDDADTTELVLALSDEDFLQPTLHVTGDVLVDWGDGESSSGTGSLDKPTPYAKTGNYVIRLTAEDTCELGTESDAALSKEYRDALLTVSMAENAGVCAGAFYGCHNLTTADLTRAAVTSASSLNSLFADCTSLQTLDLSAFDTAGVTDLSRMFAGCSSLQTLDLSGFDTSSVTEMEDLFAGCLSLRCLKLPDTFSFAGGGTERLCSLPEELSLPYEWSGSWVDADTQVCYAFDALPDNTAATYYAKAQDALGFGEEDFVIAQVMRYTGEDVVPDIRTALLEGTEYTLTLKDNRACGTATVTVTGVGNYAGCSFTTTFLIKKPDFVCEIPTDLCAVYGDILADVPLTGGWEWEDAALFVGEAGMHTFRAILIPDHPEDYDFSGIAGYEEETGRIVAELEVEVLPCPITEAMFAVDTQSVVYTGTQAEKAVTTDLVEGADYMVRYENNTDVGTAAMTICGTGNYCGELSFSFAIEQRSVFITCDNASKAVGSEDPVLTGTVDGLASEGDLGEICYIREEGETVGTYGITASYTENANYAVTVRDALFLIYEEEETEAPAGWTDEPTQQTEGESAKQTEAVPASGSEPDEAEDATFVSTDESGGEAPKAGETFDVGVLRYQVKGDNTVKVIRLLDTGKTSVRIPATVRFKSTVFPVTAVAQKAFANVKKLKKVVIGKNVEKLGARCFDQCVRLKTVSFKGTKAIKIGRHAFRGTKASCRAVFPKKMPDAAWKKMKKRLRQAGIGDKATYVRK